MGERIRSRAELLAGDSDQSIGRGRRLYDEMHTEAGRKAASDPGENCSLAAGRRLYDETHGKTAREQGTSAGRDLYDKHHPRRKGTDQ